MSKLEDVCCAVHPWIQEDGVAPDVPMDPIVQCRLKKFSAMNKLKKMAIRVRSHSLLLYLIRSIPGLRNQFHPLVEECFSYSISRVSASSTMKFNFSRSTIFSTGYSRKSV